jgi:hypothetical protein
VTQRGGPASGDFCTVIDAVITAGQGFFWNFFRIRDRIGRGTQVVE